MYISSPRRTWLLFSTIAALALLFRASPSLLPVLLGGIGLALVVSFPVNLLQRFLPRSAALVVVMVTLFVLAFLALFVVVPPLLRQLSDLVAATPRHAAEGERLLRRPG